MPALLARRLLASAALLLAAASAACDSPTHSADATVVGAWEGVSPPYPVSLADGSHNVTLHARFTFDAAGVYSELQFLVDNDRHLTLGYTQASAGHYTASGGKMVLVHEQELVRDPHSPFAANPTLAPVTPQQGRYSYQVNGNLMLLGVECPPNADCIAPYPPLQRTFLLD
jgi:hypothetical protein